MVAATALVAGCPVTIVWWLRASDTVASPVLGVILGMALSLGASQLGRVVWEKRLGSEDLLFSELMLWGFVHRWHSQRRLASARELLGPMSEAQRRALDGLSTKQQARLLEQLVAGMETRDPYLHGHSRRVARHSWMIARRMGLSREEVARVRTAAAVHDVGKTETPKLILHKKGPLSSEEYEVIKRHPSDGARMAAVLRDPELTSIVRHHHERLDGTGYPSGLAGDEIPLGARIVAVADTFDAITSARPYRLASPHKKAIDVLKAEAGTKLDPAVVGAFCSHYAGRRPLALWTSVTGLPERVLSWLGGSVGSVATTAKMVAVATLVGGTAASTSSLALPVSASHATIAHSTSTAGSRGQRVNLAGRGGSVSSRVISSSPRRGVHLAHSTVPSASAAGVPPTLQATAGGGGAVTVQPAVAADAHLVSGQGAAPRTGEGAPTKVQSERTPGTSQEAPGKSPANESAGKSGEAPGKTTTKELPAKSGEAPAHNKTKETPGKHNKAEGPPGKSGEAPGHNKPEGPPGKGVEAPGHEKAEEGPGKSVEAPGHEKPEGPPGNGGEAPGHEKPEGAPGNGGEAPGHEKPEGPPGKGGEAPGHNKTEEGPGKSGEAHKG